MLRQSFLAASYPDDRDKNVEHLARVAAMTSPTTYRSIVAVRSPEEMIG